MGKKEKDPTPVPLTPPSRRVERELDRNYGVLIPSGDYVPLPSDRTKRPLSELAVKHAADLPPTKLTAIEEHMGHGYL